MSEGAKALARFINEMVDQTSNQEDEIATVIDDDLKELVEAAYEAVRLLKMTGYPAAGKALEQAAAKWRTP